MKCLYFEPGGYCVWYKRLEQGEFARPNASADARHLALSGTELQSLLDGLDVTIKRRRKRWITAA